jgi:stress response protein YsnF
MDAYETLVAAYDTPEHALAAVNALKTGGFHTDDISTFDRKRLTAGKDALTSARHAGVWQRLFGDNINQYEANVLGDTVGAGGTVVSVRVPREQVAQASGILDLHHPVDIHDRAVTSGFAAPAHVEAATKSIAAIPLAKGQDVAVTSKLAQAQPGTLKLAEEQLDVGKKRIETGRTRVRRFTTERDVAQDVTLHDEHAEVLRSAISQPDTLREVDWADQEIEMVETKEQALISKTARVVEEVSLRSKGEEHVETIHEKLRRQQAEVQQVDATGRPVRP